jgi:hypothetical protein
MKRGASYTVHRTQNKPKKEISEVRFAELQELRSQNQKLRRENSRLKRELEKRLTLVLDEDDESLGKVENKAPKSNSEECPSCKQGELTKVPAGPKIIVACRKCKFRKTINT